MRKRTSIRCHGSSPRVWGQAIRRNSSAMEHKDHPHACGDKKSIPNTMWKKAGSSPRVWGQDEHLSDLISESRIIPTRVGTRHLLIIKFANNGDHPHACGDKPVVAICLYIPPGSSPRVWGQVSSLGFPIACCRIIPTRVGTRSFKG